MRSYANLSEIGSKINFPILQTSKTRNSFDYGWRPPAIVSPTGSGKTLTAFLTIIDSLVRHALDGTLEERVYCLYISPIKALANDIQRNLIGPLEEIEKSTFQTVLKED